jgi:hypothetical protein
VSRISYAYGCEPGLTVKGIGASLQRTPNGWRWMVGLGAVPAAMQLAMLHLLPESRKSSNNPSAINVLLVILMH